MIFVFIVGVLVLVFSFWTKEENLPREYQSTTLTNITTGLLNSISTTPQVEFMIDKNDTIYQENLAKLRACQKIDELDYQAIIDKVNTINHSFGLLHNSHFKNRYTLSMQSVIDNICKAGENGVYVTRALSLLSNQEALKNLIWYEEISSTEITAPYVEMPKHWITTANPWMGFDGCIYMENTKINDVEKTKKPDLVVVEANNYKRDGLCSKPQIYTKNNTSTQIKEVVSIGEYVPPKMDKQFIKLGSMIGNITSVNQKSLSISHNGNDVPMGHSVKITINPDIQIISQQLADCLTAHDKDSEVCKNILKSTKLSQTINNQPEEALVRKVAIAVVDVPTGKIDALASSMSPCMASDYGLINKDGCDPISKLWKHNYLSEINKSENQAIYWEYMPASTVKPIQALALYRTYPQVFSTHKDKLTEIMAQSDTERLIDVMTCYKGSMTEPHLKDTCKALSAMYQSAKDLGYNTQCDMENGRCGYRDILKDMPLNSTYNKPIFYGRLMVNENKSPLSGLDSIKPATYTERKSINGGKWQGLTEEARGKGIGKFGVLNEAIWESMGQGDALTTPLAVASMTRNLLAVADGQSPQSAYLVEDWWNLRGETLKIEGERPLAEESTSWHTKMVTRVKNTLYSWFPSLQPQSQEKQSSIVLTDNDLVPMTITKMEAQAVANLFTEGHQNKPGYTSHDACLPVFGEYCKQTLIDNRKIFTKTGTPTFDHNSRDEMIKDCDIIDINQLKNDKYRKKNESLIQKCSQRPIKWHILGISQQGDEKKWQKVIVVLVDRNWNDDKGTIIHNDFSNNDAGKISFSLMKALDENNLL